MNLTDICDRGVFSAGRARDLLGLDSNALGRLVHHGEATRLVRGWYAPGRVPGRSELHMLRTEALLQHFSGRAVAGHHSAVLLLGLPLVRADLGRVRLCRATGRQSRRTRSFVMSPAVGVPAQRTVPPAVAVVQAGLVNSPLTALVAADAALRRGVATREDLRDAIGLLSGSTGMAAVRHVLERADARHESPGETLLGHVLQGVGVRATPQVPVRDGAHLWRVDFMLDDAPVVIEFDGMTKYASARTLAEEKYREDRLRALGYEVVRIVWADLEHPQRIVDLVRAAVERAAGRRSSRRPA